MVAEPRQLVEGAPREGKTVPARGGKRQPSMKRWRHPLNRQIDVPYRTAAAIAIIEMGISDYAVIAEAVGLTVDEVRRIDRAEESSVRQLAAVGIPVGEFFKLVHRVRCPRCHNKVSVAPCVGCCSDRDWETIRCT